MDFNSWNTFWDICFGVLVTLIIAGNVLTIWIFFKQRRQKRSYSLLISLAVADLLVGIFAVPFYIKAVVSQGYTWYVISIGADVFTGTTSIYTLAVISLERMFAVGWPLRHRTLNCRVYVCAISIPWIIAAIFTTSVVLPMLNIIGRGEFLVLYCFNFWNPSDSYMCSKLCCLEEAENAISQPESYQKRSEIGEDTSSHNRNIAFYLASFSNSKYFVCIESHTKFSPY